MRKQAADDQDDLFVMLADQAAAHQAAAKAEDLAKLIRHHRHLYYNGTPQISDAEFDAYVDELKDLQPSHPALFEVGAPAPSASGWVKARHKIAMTSLDKVNTEAEILAWLKARYTAQVCVEEKLDGFSLSLDYSNGRLQRVLTRGHGEEGEDITRNAVKIRGILQVLPTTFSGSIRGEALLLKPEFEAYNAVASQRKWTTFENQRNGAAGLARRYSGEGVEYLRFFAYGLVGGPEHQTEHERMSYLQHRLDLFTPKYAVVGVDGLLKVYREYTVETRDRMLYEVDGLVVKVNDLSLARDIEQTQKSVSSNPNPKSQVAWKFAGETRVTILEDIVWELGIGGRVTPVAILSPVRIGGVTIDRASLANASRVRDLRLWKGCRVLVTRRGDVIPYVEENLDS